MTPQGTRIVASVAAVLALAAGGVSTATGRVSSPRADVAQGCADPDAYPTQRDPSNPLDLPAAPGANPLTGANFFVDGPAHGAAASAIASLIGIDPKSLPNDLSWAEFKQDHAAAIAANPQAAVLVKLADQPEANRFSLYSQGGGPGAIYA
jgi:hypothetical protein